MVVGGAATAYSHHLSKNKSADSQTSTNIPSEWTSYKNDQYGITLSYPKTWGQPEINSGQGQSKSYSVTFPKYTKRGSSNVTTLFYMDPNDLVANKSSIQSQIRSGVPSAVASDSSSYATVFSSQSQHISGLSLYQIINLPKIGITGVMAHLQVVNTKVSCPSNQFSQADTCITRSDYDNLNKITKSIKNL